MGILSELEPKNVFRYFEELCAIPHGSGNTAAISNYLVEFARAHGLKHRQDASNNVVIWKKASPGMEDAPAVMLQGHMDMVAEKEPGCAIDMDTQGLELFWEGDVIGARGTTLGGDDAIALAMGLAILDSDDIVHGPLECLFTVDEEVGMLGAAALDASDLKARYLLNLDSEEEKVFTVSCAGSARIVSTFPAERAPATGTVMSLRISGLNGGHSGEEIHKERANANKLLGRVLAAMGKVCGIRLISLCGGAKDNAIPREAEALLSVSDGAAALRAVQETEKALREEYRIPDSGITLRLVPAETELVPMEEDMTRRLISFLACVPNGVQAMSSEVPGLVQTSSNLGRLYMEGDCVAASFMVRSCMNTQRDEVVDRIALLTAALGGKTAVSAVNAAWEYRADSPLRDMMVRTFQEVYGEEPVVAALHAGLECGVLSGKLPELDCISYGPDITDIHTPRERLHVGSVKRTWTLTLEVLKRLR